MARIIAVANEKGGVGKTTTAVTLAAGLASLGKRVLLVDLDTQGQSGGSLLGEQPAAGVADWIMGDRVSFADVAMEARPNLFLLAGGHAVERLQRHLNAEPLRPELVLQKALDPVEKRFNYVFLDVPPGWSIVFMNAMFAARELVVPAALKALTLQSMIEFHRTLNGINEHRPVALAVDYLVPTFYDVRLLESREILDQLREYYGPVVCEPIRQNVRISEAPAHHKTIFEYAPDSHGAEDYAALIERILQDG